jgi:hypothetical protein
MGDPFDRARWPLPPLAAELDELAAASDPCQGSIDLRAADWAIEHLLAGVPARSLCEAAMWVGLRRGRCEGRGPGGLVTHSVLAAASCASIGALASGPDTARVAALAAVQHVAYTLGAYRGGVADEREGPTVLGWFEPHRGTGDPVQAFLDAALAGEPDLADHCWIAATSHDPARAEQALLSAAAAGYHLNEHKLVYPAQLRAWEDSGRDHASTLYRAAARYAGNHLQDPVRAESRRADAAALAMENEDRDSGGAADPEHVSVVATGIARTPPRELAPLLMASLSDGLSPEDLVHAVSLVGASRFALSSFGPAGPIGEIHAGTGANAVRRCLGRAGSGELRYELAICATESPHLANLAPVEELAVPPSDDGGLEDLLAALEDGDPDAATEAASAIPPGDPEATSAAWSAIAATAATDQWMVLHGVKHVVAMHDDFVNSDHPARIWYLAAAARTAAHATAVDQPLANRVAERMDPRC